MLKLLKNRRVYVKLSPRQKEHRRYLQTPKWRAIAATVRKRDGYRCQDCGRGGILLDVHHLTYKNWKNEKLEDLVTLCRKCHIKRHKKAKIL